MEILIDDIKEFLSTYGYSWNGKIVTRSSCVTAKSFDTFVNDAYNDNYTYIKLEKNSEKVIYPVRITSTLFEIYDECYVWGDIDSPSYEKIVDWSNQWRKFLFTKYGKEYQTHLRNTAKQQKHRIIADMTAQINRLKEKRHEISVDAKNEIEKCNEMEQLASSFDQ